MSAAEGRTGKVLFGARPDSSLLAGQHGLQHHLDREDGREVYCSATPGPASSRTAHTLNSGIPLIGSSAGLVTRFAACSPP